MRGYTLIELSIVIGIIAVLTFFGLALFQSVEQQRKLIFATQQIGADIRYVQNLALASKKTGGVISYGGYGIRFTASSNQYIIFADKDRFPSAAGSLQSAQSGTVNSITVPGGLNLGVSDRWKGGTVIIVDGKCSGNKRIIIASTSGSITVSSNFSEKGIDCVPDSTSKFVILGDGTFDASELVRTQTLGDGVQVTSVNPSNPLDLVFIAPEPTMKVSDLVGGGAAVTVSLEGISKTISINVKGEIEVTP